MQTTVKHAKKTMTVLLLLIINLLHFCYFLRIKSLEFTNLLEIYTLDVARSLCRRLQLDIVFVNCP